MANGVKASTVLHLRIVQSVAVEGQLSVISFEEFLVFRQRRQHVPVSGCDTTRELAKSIPTEPPEPEQTAAAVKESHTLAELARLL